MGGGTGLADDDGQRQAAGEIMTPRIAIWDTSDDVLDSLAAIDGFKWSATSSTPGTVIFRGKDQPQREPVFTNPATGLATP